MKNRNVILKLLAMAGFALSPIAQAVVPAPDGGYAGGNTAEGQNALLTLTTGAYNTAVGIFSLESNQTGSFNTAIGAGTLLANTGDQNTATGAGGLLSNTTGIINTANGAFALFHNAGGGGNTASGASALFNNTAGTENTAMGLSALGSNTIGQKNTAVGRGALDANTTGNNNTATGHSALAGNGDNNTAMGVSALGSNATGVNNTAVGLGALGSNTAGNNNIALGAGAGSNIQTASDTICIGIAGVNVTDGCYIGHVFEEPLDPDNLAMAIDINGKVGTLPSSRRFKDHITPMDKASESILALKPVTFHYKNDKKCSPRFGLIAEEVAQINPELVALDKDGKPFSMRYDQVNAMLLNEFLKEHKAFLKEQRKLEEQGAIIAKQQKQIEALSVGRQKISAEVEISKPASKVAANRP